MKLFKTKDSKRELIFPIKNFRAIETTTKFNWLFIDGVRDPFLISNTEKEDILISIYSLHQKEDTRGYQEMYKERGNK
jgi:hypothetical protein